MKKWISKFKNKDEKRINYDLINKKIDGDLVQYIVNTCMTLEALPSIKFVGYEYTEDATKIDFSKYIVEKQRGKDRNSGNRYRHLSDSLLGEITLHFDINHKNEYRKISKSILVPIPDENGYFLIDGTKYFLMYQITEKSTYTTKDLLVGKSNMPIQMKREFVEDNGYTIPIYSLNLFAKDVNIMRLFLAKMGYKKTLKYFGVDKIFKLHEGPKDEEKYAYVNLSSKLSLEINKHFYTKYNYVRSVAAMLSKASPVRVTMNKMLDRHFWISAVGTNGTQNQNKYYDKGVSTLLFLERKLDNTTKESLLVHPINKRDTYAYLRWMMMNFEALKAKNNMDLETKRLRCNEYITHLLSIMLTDRVNRIIAIGQSATIENICEIFKFPGDAIMKNLHHSGLLKFDDRVNDMDFYTKLKVTFKGPSSLGGTHDRTVSPTQRGLDPSYIGRLDINRCGTSDPGMSAVLTPFCKTYGMCFDDSREPEDFMHEFAKDIVEYNETMTDYHVIRPNTDSMENHYDYMQDNSEVLDNSHIYHIYDKEKYLIFDLGY